MIYLKKNGLSQLESFCYFQRLFLMMIFDQKNLIQTIFPTPVCYWNTSSSGSGANYLLFVLHFKGCSLRPAWNVSIRPAGNVSIRAGWNVSIRLAWNVSIRPAWNVNIRPAWNVCIRPAWNVSIRLEWNVSLRPAWNGSLQLAWKYPSGPWTIVVPHKKQ